jgi:hypothetical protein
MKNININDLTVYKSPYEKKRYGKDDDGGYVAVKLPCEYDVLLSGGIKDDVSFECDLLDGLNIPRAYLHDQTIARPGSQWPLEESLKNNPQFRDKRINIITKNIGVKNTRLITDLNSTMNDFNNIFVKMDIEGFEFGWLQTLTQENINKIDQMVIEFHFMPEIKEESWSILEKINKTHVLVHLHANNSHGMRSYERVGDTLQFIPKVPECTYIHKRYIDDLQNLQMNNVPLPCDIDKPNFPEKRERLLTYEPFCSCKSD